LPGFAWHQAWNSLTYWSCSSCVTANFVSPVLGLTVTQNIHGPSAGLSAAVNAQQRKTKPLSLAQLEAVYISETLAATGGNKAECARILGISRKNLYEKIARYKI